MCMYRNGGADLFYFESSCMFKGMSAWVFGVSIVETILHGAHQMWPVMLYLLIFR